MRFKARHLPSKPANSAKLRGPTSDFILGDGEKKTVRKRHGKGKEQRKSSNMEAGAMCQHSPGHTGKSEVTLGLLAVSTRD